MTTQFVAMRLTVTTQDGGSRFVEDRLPLSTETAFGSQTEALPIDGYYMRIVKPQPDDKLAGFHNAPEDQYIIQLQGGSIEIRSSEGGIKQTHAVSWSHVQDTTGQGHASRPLSMEPRLSLFIPVRR